MRNRWIAGSVLLAVIAACAASVSPSAAIAQATGAATQTAARVPAALSKEAKEALEAMAVAAEQEIVRLRNLENIQTRSPAFLLMEFDAQRRRLEVKLLRAVEKPERLALLDEYVQWAKEFNDRVLAREMIDATRVDVNRALLTYLEARYRRATEGGDSKEAEALQAPMVEAAKKAYAGILDLESIRPRTPEFLMLKLETGQKVVEMQLLQSKTAAERAGLYASHVATAKKVVEEAKDREKIDGTIASMGLALYMLHEAERAQAHDAGAAQEERAATEKMVAEAKNVEKALRDLAKIRFATEEYLQLRVEWSKKLMKAELALAGDEAGRRTALEAHEARLRELEGVAEQHAQVNMSSPFLRFEVAEAAYLKATAGG